MDVKVDVEIKEYPPITRDCPWCKSKQGFILTSFSQLTEPIGYRVECKNCYALGPLGATGAAAINEWNNGFSVRQKIDGFESIVIMKERT